MDVITPFAAAQSNEEARARQAARKAGTAPAAEAQQHYQEAITLHSTALSPPMLKHCRKNLGRAAIARLGGADPDRADCRDTLGTSLVMQCRLQCCSIQHLAVACKYICMAWVDKTDALEQEPFC